MQPGDRKYSIGTDIIDVGRVQALILSHGARFFRHVFTEEEVKWCEGRKNMYVHLAGKFAAKEAIKKALSAMGETGHLPFSSIEIIREDHSPPEAKIRWRLQGAYRFQISISHTSRLATAVALAERI